MKLRNIKIILLVIVMASLLTSCWDSVEINKRAFVIGIGLDKGTTGEINVTYEIVLPTKITKSGGGGGSEEGGEKSGPATWNITKSSDMVAHATRSLHEDIDRVVELHHTQLIVIGKELAKEGIIDKLDYFFRNPQIQKTAKIAFINEDVSKFFKIEPKTAKSPSAFVSEILDSNTKYSQTIGTAMDLSKLTYNIRNNFDFILTQLKIINNQVKIEGAAAFKNGKYVTGIEKNEVEALRWAWGEIGMGTVEVSDPGDPSRKVVYEISGGNGKLRPVFSGNKVNFVLDLNIEGDITEIERTNFLGTLKGTYINAVEGELQNKIKKRIRDVYDKYEKGKKVDVFQLKRKIRNYNIDFYNKNKETLDDIIANSDIDINVNAKIRRVGLNR